jgi:hypothetical protein
VDAPELSLLGESEFRQPKPSTHAASANAGVALQVTTADPNARPTKTRRRIAINRSPRMHALRLERYIFKRACQAWKDWQYF